ncbi:hypothetical protein MXD81_42285, partial [Microbacteriaceae bacterium K1510]|nr:hypothetical protein [Microbacteriaceae bacterium K1510]
MSAANLRTNSRLRKVLGEYGVEFLEYALGAFQRILPHVQLSDWTQDEWSEMESVWVNSQRRRIRVRIPVGVSSDADARSLSATIKRRQISVAAKNAGGTLDTREFDICKCIATRITEITRGSPSAISGATMRAIRD